MSGDVGRQVTGVKLGRRKIPVTGCTGGSAEDDFVMATVDKGKQWREKKSTIYLLPTAIIQNSLPEVYCGPGKMLIAGNATYSRQTLVME